MITLATLKDASAQEVFDQVAKHLLTQIKKSKDDEGQCLYRHGELKCAAGCLISDDEYHDEMDQGSDVSWESLIEKDFVSAHHVNLISELQCVHDSYNPDGWFNALKHTADKFGLEFKHEA